MTIMYLSLKATHSPFPYRKHEEANVPRPWGGCDPARGTSAQAENSLTHDFAQNMSA